METLSMLSKDLLTSPEPSLPELSSQQCFTSSSQRATHSGFTGKMFLWAGSKGAQGSGSGRRSIYHKIREYDILEKRRTVTALKAGEDRAILLGLSMILFSAMMYFVLGITMVRSYSDSVWTGESNCTVLNSTVVAEVNCSYSCGSECRKSSRYPCLQVYVSLNSTGRALKLSHNEEVYEANPECFYIPKCRKDHTLMTTIVMNISERLKTHMQVSCYYDPSDQHDAVLLTRLYGRRAVVSSLLWPTCTLVGGMLIIAMVKLTQYLSFLCEQIGRIKRMGLYSLTGNSKGMVGTRKYNSGIQDKV